MRVFTRDANDKEIAQEWVVGIPWESARSRNDMTSHFLPSDVTDICEWKYLSISRDRNTLSTSSKWDGRKGNTFWKTPHYLRSELQKATMSIYIRSCDYLHWSCGVARDLPLGGSGGGSGAEVSVEVASGSFSFGLAGSSASSRGGLELLRIKWTFYNACLKVFSSEYLTVCVIFTARKRSLGQGNIFAPVCHSVHGGST